jgi:type II secretory pathway component PulM
MSIKDRDYMKRPSDDDDERSSSPESTRAEEFAQRVLARSRKLLLIGGIVLGIVIIFALVMSKLSGGH